MQPPPQLRSPGGQAQVPFWQVVPFWQALPQPPQFRSSVWGSMQAPLQASCPGKQLGTAEQLPFLHREPAGQALPQLPQFVVSF